jgi:hypothetical protein
MIGSCSGIKGWGKGPIIFVAPPLFLQWAKVILRTMHLVDVHLAAPRGQTMNWVTVSSFIFWLTQFYFLQYKRWTNWKQFSPRVYSTHLSQKPPWITVLFLLFILFSNVRGNHRCCFLSSFFFSRKEKLIGVIDGMTQKEILRN